MKPLYKLFGALIILNLLITTIHAETISEEIHPTTISEMTAQVIMGGNGKINELKEGEEVKLQILTFQNNPNQKIVEIQEELTINDKKIKPTYSYDEFDNKYVNFIITENGKFVYEIKAIIETKTEIQEIEDYEIKNFEEKIANFTTNSEKIESNSLEITTLAKNKLTQKSFLESINKTITWVNDYVEYAKRDEFKTYYLLQKSSIETLLEKKGVCDEFANLATAMLRANNIPTKIIIGITFDGKEWGNHAWIETYHPKIGWIPNDPTFRESGFVDATHIKIGAFKDITQSLAKATYPTTTNITLQTQILPKVEILEKKYFEEVEIKIKNTELKTNQWNELKLEITNKTNKTINTPLNLKENYKEILMQEKNKSILLKPYEKKEVTFKLYPTIELQSNEIAKGKLTFNTLSAPIIQEITIKKGDKIHEGTIIINDITPITTQKEILIDITATNYNNNKGTIDINANNNNKNYYWSEEIAPFAKQNFRKTIDNNNSKVQILVETKNQKIEQTFYPTMQKISIKEEQKETTVIQKIEPTKDTPQNLLETLTNSPILILFAILPAIAIIIIGILLTKKQYI